MKKFISGRFIFCIYVLLFALFNTRSWALENEVLPPIDVALGAQQFAFLLDQNDVPGLFTSKVSRRIICGMEEIAITSSKHTLSIDSRDFFVKNYFNLNLKLNSGKFTSIPFVSADEKNKSKLLINKFFADISLWSKFGYERSGIKFEMSKAEWHYEPADQGVECRELSFDAKRCYQNILFDDEIISCQLIKDKETEDIRLRSLMALVSTRIEIPVVLASEKAISKEKIIAGFWDAIKAQSSSQIRIGIKSALNNDVSELKILSVSEELAYNHISPKFIAGQSSVTKDLSQPISITHTIRCSVPGINGKSPVDSLLFFYDIRTGSIIGGYYPNRNY